MPGSLEASLPVTLQVVPYIRAVGYVPATPHYTPPLRFVLHERLLI